MRDRTLRVVINGESSQHKDVTSGISQGSVLGPLLFVIFINNLPEQVKVDILLFEDDANLFRNIKEPDDQDAAR